MIDLRAVLLRECSTEHRAQLEADPGLADALALRLHDAQRAWPSATLDPAEFASYLAHRLPPDSKWRRLHTSDLYLAAGCTAGLHTSLTAFEAAFFGDLRPVARRVYADVDLDELGQEVRARLFVREAPRPPRIASYDGRGELRSWFRVAVMRTAINRRRAQRNTGVVSVEDELLEAVVPRSHSPELEPYKDEYSVAVRNALVSAIGELTVRHRLVLRYSTVDRLSLQDIGTLLGVHKSSAHRQVALARTKLVEAIRRQLESELNVSGKDLESVILLALSRVEVTLSRVLTP